MDLTQTKKVHIPLRSNDKLVLQETLKTLK